MHICWDEIQIFLFSLPFIGLGLTYLRSKFARAKKSCPCDHEHDQEHA